MMISARLRPTDSCGRVLTNYWISSAYFHFIDYRQKIDMAAKHWSVNSIFWRVVAGRIGRGRGPPVGQIQMAMPYDIKLVFV